MDIRRELDLINKHFRKHHDTAGETVVWYEFSPFTGASATASAARLSPMISGWMAVSEDSSRQLDGMDVSICFN